MTAAKTRAEAYILSAATLLLFAVVFTAIFYSATWIADNWWSYSMLVAVGVGILVTAAAEITYRSGRHSES